jgi:hypothetical protein
MPHKEDSERGKDKKRHRRDESHASDAKPEEVNAIELKTVEIRLNGIKEATHRSRFVFLVMTVVASTILLTVWNNCLSWERGMAFSLNKLHESPNDPASASLRILVNEWIRSLGVSIGLLGSRVSGSDLSIIGSACLIVVMTWYFYSQRRENRAIVSLLQDCYEGYEGKRVSKTICSMVFAGIVHSLVFIDLGKGDKPVSGLERSEKQGQGKKENIFLIRSVIKALVYLPPITIFLVIITDVVSLYIDSPFRPPGSLNHNLEEFERNKAIIFDSFGGLSALYTWYLCRKSTRFSKATTNTLIEYQAFIRPLAKVR